MVVVVGRVKTCVVCVEGVEEGRDVISAQQVVKSVFA